MTNGVWLDFDVHAYHTGWDDMLDENALTMSMKDHPESGFTTTMACAGYNVRSSAALGLFSPQVNAELCLHSLVSRAT